MRTWLTLVAFCLGNLIGPQMFQVSDAPNYTPAKLGLIIIMSVLSVLAVLLRQLMVWENAMRDKEQAEPSTAGVSDNDLAFADLTDMENRKFRYVY